MSTKIISFLNHKGGVGKTTTVASLGAALAGKGYRILLVDLDAQTNLTSSLLQEEPELSVYDSLIRDKKLPIYPVKERLDLVPASSEMISIELELAKKIGTEGRLRRALEKVAKDYEYILLDCPPSLGLVSINALAASTDVIVPLTAEALPTKGLTKIAETIELVQSSVNEQLSLSGILITRYEKGKLSATVEDYLRETYGEKVLETKIRKNVAIAEAPLSFVDILEYSPDSNGAKDYRALADEVVSKMVIR